MKPLLAIVRKELKDSLRDRRSLFAALLLPVMIGVMMFTGESQTSVADDKLRQAQQALSEVESERASRQSQFELTATTPPEALPRFSRARWRPRRITRRCSPMRRR